jgi:ring-1,2-phenylacetyl-CoA epoxidase subunit PaaC
MNALQQATFDYLLRLGDSDLILAQRLAEWSGHGPALEEELATANVGLDLLGQARLWYGYAVELEGAGRSEDDLAFLRDAGAWRNFLLVEQPNGNYGDTLARQFLFDSWHMRVLTGLTASSDARIVEIAAKSVKEVAYHLRRSAELVVRLGDGTPESHTRMQAAIERLWPYTGELFTRGSLDAVLEEAAVVPAAASLEAPWRDGVGEVFAEGTLLFPARAWMQSGGTSGRHTEHLGRLLAEMQFLQRAYPGAQW